MSEELKLGLMSATCFTISATLFRIAYRIAKTPTTGGTP